MAVLDYEAERSMQAEVCLARLETKSDILEWHVKDLQSELRRIDQKVDALAHRSSNQLALFPLAFGIAVVLLMLIVTLAPSRPRNADAKPSPSTDLRRSTDAGSPSSGAQQRSVETE
jgi:hypothetical protein